MKFLKSFFLIFSVIRLSCYADNLPSSQEDHSVFLGIIIKNNDQLIPLFLKSIENMDYQKKLIHLQFNICNDTPEVKAIVTNWIEKNLNAYKEISCFDNVHQFENKENVFEKNRIFGEIKNDYLEKCKKYKCDFCFIVASDALLFPHVLKYLIPKNKPIIAPLLRPIPESNDPFRNFFADITANGYYKDHSEYYPIANRQKLGTFNVPCIHYAYLINSEYVDQLSFTKNFSDWEFLSFSKNARENNIPQFVCNEKEFGFFLHFKTELTKEKEKSFSLIGSEFEITSSILTTILSSHYEDDPYLKKYANDFNFCEYAIYRVQNKDLYYLDEVNDYIKNYVIKQGLNWEEYIHEQFRKYVKPGTVALDIGSHMGTHTLNLSRIVGENGTVHAFEPQAKMFCELAINMYLNHCKNVCLHHKALGSEEKWVGMHIPKEEWTKRFSEDLVNEGHGTVIDSSEITDDKVKMIKLDDLGLNNVSLIKIDVEGFEMEVLKGGLETIKRNKPFMIIELFPGPQRVKKIQEIEKIGYIYSHLQGDDYLFIPMHVVGITPPSQNEKIVSENTLSEQILNVTWEGSFLDLGSLSHVNRSLTKELAKIANINLTCVSSNHLPSKLAFLPELEQIAKSLHSKAPDNTQVTVRHAWPPNWQPPICGKWVLIQPWEFGTLPEDWVQNMQKVDEIWVPTHFVKNEYIDSGIPEDKIYVVPHGIDPTKFHPEGEPFKLETRKKFKFLFLGGTIYRKGCDILLKSYQKCFTDSDDVCLVIKDFGNHGPYAQQTYENQIKIAQKSSHAPEIIYLDQEMSTDEIASLYKACDCLVYPYRGEGFALPVLEAMACGLPVIVTSGGATEDFVSNEFGWFIPSTVRPIGSMLKDIKLIKEGWLLEPDIEILTALLRWVSENPYEAYAKGLAASKHVKQQWTWQKAAIIAAKRLIPFAKNKNTQ